MTAIRSNCFLIQLRTILAEHKNLPMDADDIMQLCCSAASAGYVNTTVEAAKLYPHSNEKIFMKVLVSL